MREKSPLHQGYESYLSLLAKAEVEQLCAVRMRFREKKRRQAGLKGRTHVFDHNGNLESALEMVETLPQGTFCVQMGVSLFVEWATRLLTLLFLCGDLCCVYVFCEMQEVEGFIRREKGF